MADKTLSTIDEFKIRVRETVSDPAFRRAVFTFNAKDAANPGHWERLIVRPIQVKNVPHLQFSYFTARQDVTKNYRDSEATAHLDEALNLPICTLRLETESDSWALQISKRGTPIVHHETQPTNGTSAPPDSAKQHDRRKRQPFPANQPDPLLFTLGLINAEGQVRPSMHAKFAQVNSFLELLDQQLDVLEALAHRPIRLLDCGCGAAYLSLAAYHYLNEVRKLPATLTGIDYNGGLIQSDAEIARSLGYGDACFLSSAIADYQPDQPPDVLLALHACDTASDDALALGIRSGATLILCAPCCHAQLRRELKPTAPFGPVMRHGILERRLADLLTDSFRALILRLAGYKTDVVEFVAPEHTDKNLLIRAVKKLPPGDPSTAAEYKALKDFWGVTPYLERLLGGLVV